MTKKWQKMKTSGIPSHEGERGSSEYNTISKMPKIIHLASTGLRISVRLAKKTNKDMVCLLTSH